MVDAAGEYTLSFDYISYGDRSFDVEIDSGASKRVEAANSKGALQTVSLDVKLNKGLHTIRLSNANGWAPDIDRMTIVSKK